MGSGNIIKEAIKKYGVDKFVREFIFFAFDKDSMAWAEEQLVITQDQDSLSYNIVPGGGLPPFNDRTGSKNPTLSKKNKERVWSQESLKKARDSKLGNNNPMFGIKRINHSNTMKSKVHITNGIENKFIDKSLPLPDGWHYGRVLKKRTKLARRGFKQSPEHIQKIQETKSKNRMLRMIND
jgi:hypothetical protein